MKRRTWRRLIVCISAVFTAVTLLVGGLAVWVSIWPFPVDFLKPYLEKALVAMDVSHVIQIDRLEMVWGGWERGIDLQAHEVVISDLNGNILGDSSKIAVELSFKDLLKGKISPKRVYSIAPRILIYRPRDGKFQISRMAETAVETGMGTGDQADHVRDLVERIFTPPDPAQDFGRFTTIGVEHGSIEFDDEERGVSWELEDISIEITREKDAVYAFIEIVSEELDRGGSMAFRLPYQTHQDTLRVQVELTDLNPATLYQIFPEMAPFTTVENPMSGSIAYVIPSGEGPVRSKFHLKTEEFVAEGSSILKRDLSAVERVDIERFEHAGTSISGTGVTKPDGSYELKVWGERFDFGHFLDRVDEGGPVRNVEWTHPYRLEIELDEVVVGSDEGFHGFTASASFDGNNWDSVRIEAGVGEEARLSFAYEPFEGGHRLSFTTGDAGRVLHVLPYDSEFEGGELKITGFRKGADQPLVGEIDLRNARQTKAPVTAKILQVVGLTGIVSAMRKDGLPIKRLGAEFEYKDGTLQIRKGYARGGSIGMTAEGTMALHKEDALDFKGVVVPAAGFQTTVSRIPVLGWILAGGKNEGIIAFNYAVSGTLEDPRVGMNPASGVTPGFLRKLFWPRRSESKKKARKREAADTDAAAEIPDFDLEALGE